MATAYRVTRKCYDYTNKTICFVRYNVTARSPKEARQLIEFHRPLNQDRSPNRLYDFYYVKAVKLVAALKAPPNPQDIPPLGQALFISWEIRPLIEE